jgi:hypothetical protein
MWRQVEAKHKEKIQYARFISVTCDEVTSIDNGSWISIHAYVVQKWSQVLILLTLVHVLEGGTFDNLTKVIIDAVKEKGGLGQDDIPEKLMCFGVGGIQLVSCFSCNCYFVLSIVSLYYLSYCVSL